MTRNVFWIDYYKEDGEISPCCHDIMDGDDTLYPQAVEVAKKQVALHNFAKAEVKFKFIDDNGSERLTFSTLSVINYADVADKKGGAQ